MKKSVASFLAVACLFQMVGCDKGTNTENIVNIWTCSANTKVLKTVDYAETGNHFSIKAFQNESESAQIIISPTQDVDEYTISLNDLTSEDGLILSKENFSVYNEKYILVETIKDVNLQTIGGYYPDALLPFDKAVEYDENKIEGGNNQGIYVTLKVPADQQPGIYTGNFNLIVDGEQYVVPATVEVYDFLLPTATNVKSSYGILPSEIAYGELDTSQEMYKTYYDFLLDYRICGQDLPASEFRGDLTKEIIDGWVESAYEYACDERVSHYNAIYSTKTISNGYYVDQAGEEVAYSGLAVDVEKLEQTYDALFKKSMKEGVDLFEKLGTYFVIFDEAEANGKMGMANYCLYTVNQKQAECINKYQTNSAYKVKADDKGDEEFKQKLIQSLANVKHKFVGSYTEELQTEATYVPTIDNYNLQATRELYSSINDTYYGEGNGELWSYHCMNPYAPYPTVHMEDEVLGTRVMGWMMQAYNVVGSLYWDVTLYAYRDDWVNNKQLSDYYDTALRFPLANGDGFLVYPGAPYGIYGPVPSIRLAALRDAFEDYDLLYALEESYKEQGMSDAEFDAVMNIINTRLFSGAKVKRGTEAVEAFDEARDTLAELLVLAKKGVVVTDISEEKDSTAFTIQTPADTQVKMNGAVVNGYKDGEKATYTVDASRELSRNELNLSFGFGQEELSLNVYVGGKQRIVTADIYNVTVKTENGEYQAEKVTIDNDKGINVVSPALTKGDRSDDYLAIALDGFGLNAKTQKLIFYVYNNGNETQNMDVYFQSEGKFAPAVKFESYVLQPGLNILTMDVSILMHSTTLANMRLLFTETKAIDLTLSDFVIAE